MYEPKYLPQFKARLTALPEIGLSVLHSKKHVQQSDPDADPLHVHQYLEIFINLSSDVSFLVNNTLYPVPIGDLLVTRPGDIHMAIFHKSAVHEHICIWVDADLASPLFSFLHKSDFVPLFSFGTAERENLRALALSLLAVNESEGAVLEKTSYLLQILTMLKKGGACRAEEAPIPAPLQRILDDIHENFASIRTVGDIVGAHFVSPATLTRWFRTHLHASPRDYLEAVRLSNAAILLSNGCSVTDACMRSGFADCSHFIVLFKKKFGVTPLQYKKQWKGTLL